MLKELYIPDFHSEKFRFFNGRAFTVCPRNPLDESKNILCRLKKLLSNNIELAVSYRVEFTYLDLVRDRIEQIRQLPVRSYSPSPKDSLEFWWSLKK